MKNVLRAILVVGLLSAGAFAAEEGRFFNYPTIANDTIVFTYESDLWTVNAKGGVAARLTTFPGTETMAKLSPDGKWIAFTGTYEGNADVYVMPASGGVPKRLTFHPGADVVAGWTPDSKAVLFRSNRNSYSRFNRLFTVALDGGLPHEVPLPEGIMGSFSPDGRSIAYVPAWA